jgi:hypothetical protein
VPLHVARQVMRLITPLVVDFSASRRLVIDYFASAAHLGASARRAACHAAHRATHRRLLCLAQARCRLLRLAQACRRQLCLAQASRRLLCLRHMSGCLGTSRSSSRGSSCPSSSTTSPPPRVRVPRHVVRLVMWLIAPLVVDYSSSRRLVVDYFDSAVCPGASARRAAHHAARRDARRRLLRLP